MIFLKKPVLISIFLIVLTCQSKEVLKLSSRNGVFKCTLIGDVEDINRFLGEEYTYRGDINVRIFGSSLLFYEEQKSLIRYIYNLEDNILHTMNYPSLSTQLPNERKYKVEILEDNSNRIILKVKTKNSKTFTKLKGRFVTLHLLKKNSDTLN